MVRYSHTRTGLEHVSECEITVERFLHQGLVYRNQQRVTYVSYLPI